MNTYYMKCSVNGFRDSKRKTYITDIQKYSIHDGEGIRTTIFFKGCPLSCLWCHNPETQSFWQEPFFYEERCTGCGQCSQDCPHQAIRMETELNEKDRQSGSDASQAGRQRAVTDRSLCITCGRCLDSCVNNAREICGRAYTVRELVTEVLKDQAFYETSGGGVTLSGGEVLSQDMEYILELVKILYQKGVSINIDTCGQVRYNAIEKVLPYTDVFLYDLKLMDADRHRHYTGVSNEQILENLIRLAKDKGRIWIRIPVIGKVNDTVENMEQTADFLNKNHIQPEHIHLLPYHDMGRGKYSRLAREYQQDFTVPDQERMEQLQHIFAEAGFTDVRIGG